MDLRKEGREFQIGMSRFQFAHSVEPIQKVPEIIRDTAAEFDKRQILIPTKV